MTDREGVTVEIIRCAGCARLGVAIGGTRITAHKCAGKWHVEREELVARGTIADALESTRAETEGK
jgi:hypothetical protein